MNGPPASTLLDRLRADGAPRFDPVGFHFIEALARRASARQGASRALLDERLARLLADYQRRLDLHRAHTAPAAAGPAAPVAAASPAARSALAALLEAFAAGPAPGDGAEAPEDAALPGSPNELKTLKNFRRTWSRLSVDLRLTPALAKVPENAGPLNSHMLALRALKLMRELSPAYLDHFMSHLDALMWLDQTGADASPSPRAATPADSDRARKPGRRRG